ncbi:hypothetical protein R3P38DRAFT_3463920 [Favolaschia claudopus]|uniref:Uncharacterized protein n=1 Tax=Favolaschia claudopus TaxID=2862362 RepID=A0AAV9ZFY2_9AGAR
MAEPGDLNIPRPETRFSRCTNARSLLKSSLQCEDCNKCLWYNPPTALHLIPEDVQIRCTIKKSAKEDGDGDNSLFCPVDGCRTAAKNEPRKANKGCLRPIPHCSGCCKAAAVMGEELSCIGSDGRRHECISAHIYSMFPRDSNSMGTDDDVNTSGGEDAEDDEFEVARLLLLFAAGSFPALSKLSASRSTAARNTRSTARAAAIPHNTPRAGPSPIASGTPHAAAARTTADASASTPDLSHRTLRDATASAATARARRVLRDLQVTRARTRSLSPEPVFTLPSTQQETNVQHDIPIWVQ